MTYTLASSRAKDECFVLAIDGEMMGGHRRRLAELGVRPGATFRVLQRTAGGGVVISNGASRYAVDKRTASHIAIRPSNSQVAAS